MASNEMKLKYAKILADDSGETHFKDEELVMREANYAPPAPPVWVGPQGNAMGITIVAFPPGWSGESHPAPKAQWMMILTGAIEVEVSDGEKRTFTAGTADSFAYLDDIGSKGHISRPIGDEPAIIAVTEVV